MRRRKAGSVSTKARVRTITRSTSRRAATGAKAVPSEFEHRLQRERPLLRLECAGVELGDVEQRVEQRFDGAQARIDLAAEVVAGIAVDHRRGEQARGMQRLQEVVARRGDEARLAEIGGLGLGAARLELGGALDDPLLQRLGGAAQLAVAVVQRLGGAHARGHVVAGRDEAAARQRIEPQLDHQTAPSPLPACRPRGSAAHRAGAAGRGRAAAGRRSGRWRSPAGRPCRRRRCPCRHGRGCCAGCRSCSGSPPTPRRSGRGRCAPAAGRAGRRRRRSRAPRPPPRCPTARARSGPAPPGSDIGPLPAPARRVRHRRSAPAVRAIRRGAGHRPASAWPAARARRRARRRRPARHRRRGRAPAATRRPAAAC